MTKIRRLEPYGFNEQPQFNGLANTVKANIENIKEKNQEQDKKDESQDENIKQAVDKSVVTLEMQGTPSKGSNRTYVVKQGGNEIGKIEIPFSSLVKSTTYDAENNLLIFTDDNDNDIKVNLTDLIEDADLVQRRIFDDFKNEVNSFSSNTTDSISELAQKLGSGFTGANTVTSVIERNEKVVSASLNDLNDKKLDASAYTKTDLSDYYKKEETSGKTDLDAAFNKKANSTDLTAHTGDSTIHITSDERTKWNNADTNSHTHTNKDVLDKITAIDTELSKTSNNLVVNSAITKVIVDNEKVVTSSLNDLNDRKLDASAYTKTDLSDYYKKEETSGKSEIDTALAAKANTGHTHSSNDITDKVTGITDSNSGSTSVPTVNAVMQLINAKLDINYTGFTGTILTGVTTIIEAIQKIADKLDKLPNS